VIDLSFGRLEESPDYERSIELVERAPEGYVDYHNSNV
jgi:hypothetical protein